MKVARQYFDAPATAIGRALGSMPKIKGADGQIRLLSVYGRAAAEGR